MAKMKYINFEHLGLVIFEEIVAHSTMSQLVGHKPISAGFVSLPNQDECGNEASCWGKSSSLNLESTEEDTATLRRRGEPLYLLRDPVCEST